jgi:hypothetical protein
VFYSNPSVTSSRHSIPLHLVLVLSCIMVVVHVSRWSSVPFIIFVFHPFTMIVLRSIWNKAAHNRLIVQETVSYSSMLGVVLSSIRNVRISIRAIAQWTAHGASRHHAGSDKLIKYARLGLAYHHGLIIMV